MDNPSVTDIMQSSLNRDEVASRVDRYVGAFDASKGGDVHKRKSEYTTMVNDYYDLVTDFYEFGWGQAFHFAPRHKGESFPASIARHEFFLALRLGLKSGMKVADFGCGVGGPMRAIARFSGASVTGLNNNDYQIKRGTKQNADAGLSHITGFQKCDFLHTPFADGHFDAAYAIEATCHAPDKKAIYGEIFRVIKPGGEFAAYEWCVTDKYNKNDPEQRAIIHGIEEGDALPELATTHEVIAALKAVGFEVIEHRDLVATADPETPWYLPLADPKWYASFNGFRSTKPGRWVTHQMVRALEAAKIAPKGSTAVSTFLEKAAVALVAGGQREIFTPMFYFHVRKPK